MMDELAGVDLFVLKLPYRATVQFRSSRGAGGVFVLLRLTTISGVQGIAEVTGIPNVAASDPTTLAAEFDRVLRPAMTGAQSVERERVLAAVERAGVSPIAKALIDTALWDLEGKLCGQPVWRLLGGTAPAPVPVTAILFGDTPEAMLADAERVVARGIRSLKVKLWRHSLDDVHLVRDIRAAVGGDVLIYADANHAYSEDEALALLPQLTRYNVTFFEDPCNVSAERLSALRSALVVPVLAEIPIDSPAAAKRYIETGAAGALSVHLRRTGISDSRNVVAMCEAGGIPAIVGTDLESQVGALARVHLRAAIPYLAGWPAEIQFFERLAGGVLAEPLEITDGAIAVPDRPGFGTTIDEDKLQYYRVREGAVQ
jgi:L-Ala-D/L-Glu epimerase